MRMAAVEAGDRGGREARVPLEDRRLREAAAELARELCHEQIAKVSPLAIHHPLPRAHAVLVGDEAGRLGSTRHRDAQHCRGTGRRVVSAQSGVLSERAASAHRLRGGRGHAQQLRGRAKAVRSCRTLSAVVSGVRQKPAAKRLEAEDGCGMLLVPVRRKARPLGQNRYNCAITIASDSRRALKHNKT